MNSIYKFLSSIMPRKLLYWSVIRSWSIATTQTYTNKTPEEVNLWMTLRSLESK